jgi:predicted nucleic acid-binding protein
MTDRDETTMFTPGVVVDTNVFVASGFNEDSHSRQILDAMRAGDLILVWNEATRSETLSVIDQIPPLSSADVEGIFEQRGRWERATEPDTFDRVEDPSDRKFAALAASTGTALVTNDDDLLGPRQHLRVAIYTPREYVERIGEFAE